DHDTFLARPPLDRLRQRRVEHRTVPIDRVRVERAAVDGAVRILRHDVRARVDVSTYQVRLEGAGEPSRLPEYPIRLMGCHADNDAAFCHGWAPSWDG